MGRPRGLPWKTAANSLSLTKSAGSSAYMPISSRMTPRSVSTSASAKALWKNMSQRMSRASRRWVSRHRAWKQVFSLVVKALIWPPMASIRFASSSAEQLGVPLKSMCSMTWAAPLSEAFSSREPVVIQMPRAAERTPGIRSEAMRTPLGRVVS